MDDDEEEVHDQDHQLEEGRGAWRDEYERSSCPSVHHYLTYRGLVYFSL